MKFSQKQAVKRKVKGISGFIFRIIAIVLIATLVAGAAVYLQKLKSDKEDKVALIEAELVNEVKSDEGTFNISVIGNLDAKHTIVTISDLGVQDFAIYAKRLTSNLRKSAKLVIFDRLGSGYSSDTHKAMTIEKIVNDYRTMLTKQGISGPYILLAHNIGGAYATYWESMYPDEIEGVIYLDPVELSDNMVFDTKVETKDYLYAGLSTIGLGSVFYEKFYGETSDELSSSDAKHSLPFNKHSTYTFARLSEKSLLNENMQKAYESIQKNNIPKMYICSSYTFERESEVRDYVTFANKKAMLLDKDIECDINSEYYETYWKDKVANSQSHLANETTTFMNLLGNCHLVKMPGDKYIYEQYTEDTKAAVTGFIRYLDGRAPEIYSRYFDPVQQKWEEYASTIDWEAIKQAEMSDDEGEIVN